jgi:hypothetical protein
VNRLGTPSIAGSNIRAMRDEILGETCLMRGSGDVQRSVTGIYVVMNRSEEVRVRILAARSGADWTNGEIGCRVKPSRRL